MTIALPGFTDPDDSLLGVVISHPHQDHYGLARYVRPEVPVWIGKDAHNIMKAASAWVPDGQYFPAPRFMTDRAPFGIGPFRITPYLVDHSAFDAYSLLVEADGRRVFYSGDFRAHGRKAKLFEAMVRRPPADIDVLLMEGTTIGREGAGGRFPTEAHLEAKFAAAFRETKGIHFVWASSQNLDRLVTIYRAAKRTGRMLVIDLYTAVILEATGRDSIPQSDWPDVRLYIPQSQRVLIKKNELFADLGRHKANRIFPEDLPGMKERAVMLFRPLTMRDDGIAAVLDGARLSYSMWQGYLKDESTKKVRDWLAAKNIPMELIHTSGHASPADLQRLAHAPRATQTRPDPFVRNGPVRGILRQRRPAGRWYVVVTTQV